MRRINSNKSSFSRHEDSRCEKQPMSEGEQNLQHYLTKLGLPSGLHGAVRSVYDSMESRIWILDNSYDMNIKDCSLIKAHDKLETIGREGGVSRWDEQLQCVDFHLKMAARTWMPTKFWMTNKPQKEAQRHGVSWGDPGHWADERENTSRVIFKNLSPEQKANPLAYEIGKVRKKLEPQAARLKEDGMFVSVIICTHGVPMDEAGESSSASMKEFMKSLKALAELPVRIVFRLCTGKDKVLNFYKKIDIDFDCDVLGSYWEEAKEVYFSNPWLTYGIGLHRMREAGLGTELMDVLDERPFSLDELYEFCVDVFVGDGDMPLRHPTEDWDGFIIDLQVLVGKEKLVFNPIKDKLCPWIDVNMLKSMPQRSAGRRSSSTYQESRKKKPGSHRRRATVSEVDHPDMPSKSASFHASHNSFRRSSSAVDSASNSRIRDSFNSSSQSSIPHKSKPTVSRSMDPSDMPSKSTSFHARPESFRRSCSNRDPLSNSEKRDSFNHSAESDTPHNSKPTMPSHDPLPRTRTTRKSSSFHDPLKSSQIIMNELQHSLFDYFDEKPEEKSLSAVIKDWSHEANGKLRPLEVLLFEVPVLFPPNNPLVKHHDYFEKWKTIHRDAFMDDNGETDEKDELVRKVARRCKIFLHPDKWPTNLCDDQRFLLQSIWDVFQESALF